MARTEAPASSESRRQQQFTTPAATAPLLDSTNADLAAQRLATAPGHIAGFSRGRSRLWGTSGGAPGY
jgi:hypothetical protein